MKKLIQYLVTSIVDNPKKVKVEEISSPISGGITQFSVTVAPEDMGRIIGKQGRIIRAVRDILRVKSIILNQKAILTLKDNSI